MVGIKHHVEMTVFKVGFGALFLSIFNSARNRDPDIDHY